MIKLSSEEIEQIVENDLPDYQVSEDSKYIHSASEEYDSMDSKKTVQVEASTPNIKSLRMKYLHERYLRDSAEPHYKSAVGSVDEHTEDLDNSDDVAEDVIIAIKPKTSLHAWDRSARPKAAIISGREKKVIGQQG